MKKFNTTVEDEYNDVGICITLLFSDFRIESEGGEDTQENVFLRGTMIFDFINTYIKRNNFISKEPFEVLQVDKEKPIGDNVQNGYEVMIYIGTDSDYFVSENDDGNFYNHDLMSEIFDYTVTQKFDNIDITSYVGFSFFSGGG